MRRISKPLTLVGLTTTHLYLLQNWDAPHAGQDTWVARQIARAIEEQGGVAFLDEANIDIGAEFEEAIRDFLDRAHELLVLITPWALERPYVWAEIGAAWIRRIPIVIVLHGLTRTEFLSQPNAPVFLKSRDVVELNEIDQYFSQLKIRIMEAEQ